MTSTPLSLDFMLNLKQNITLCGEMTIQQQLQLYMQEKYISILTRQTVDLANTVHL
jgi:hypothetical protein